MSLGIAVFGLIWCFLSFGSQQKLLLVIDKPQVIKAIEVTVIGSSELGQPSRCVVPKKFRRLVIKETTSNVLTKKKEKE